MNIATDLKTVSGTRARLPVPKLSLPPLPKDVESRFPSLVQWKRDSDKSFDEWLKKLQTTLESYGITNTVA